MANDLYIAPAPDVDTNTINAPRVDTFTYDETVFTMAHDLVKGHLEDYYFFQYDDDEYVLIFSNEMQVDSNAMSCGYCHVVVYQRLDIPDTVSDSVNLTGDITEVGASPSVDSISLTGSVSSMQYTHKYKVFDFSMPSIHVYQNGYAYYSSVGDYAPKLVEGVSYYAFAAFVLCFLVIAFRLTDRIFRRFY